MEFQQLKYFLEIANYLNFSKAGRALHISQSALSMVVKNLEEELGVRLLDRSTKRVALTDAGEILKIYSENMMHTLQELQGALGRVSDSKIGKVKLGLPPVIGATFFPGIIAKFHDIQPQITVEVTEEGSKLIERLIGDGDIDLGAVVLPVNESQFESITLVKRQLNLVVNSDHPLAKTREQVNIQSLRGERFIMFRRGFALYERVRDACIQHGFAPNIVFESSSWDFISEMVSEKQGIAFLPDAVCKKINLTRCTVISQLETPIPWDLALIWRKNTYLSFVTKTFIDFIQNEFAHHHNFQQIV